MKSEVKRLLVKYSKFTKLQREEEIIVVQMPSDIWVSIIVTLSSYTAGVIFLIYFLLLQPDALLGE